MDSQTDWEILPIFWRRNKRQKAKSDSKEIRTSSIGNTKTPAAVKSQILMCQSGQYSQYHHLYHSKRLNQKEKWIIGPQWLAQYDEYKKVENGDKIQRLDDLVQSIRSSFKNDLSQAVKWGKQKECVCKLFSFKNVYLYQKLLKTKSLFLFHFLRNCWIFNSTKKKWYV